MGKLTERHRLYDAGLTDKEMATALNITHAAAQWRYKHKLPPNRKYYRSVAIGKPEHERKIIRECFAAMLCICDRYNLKPKQEHIGDFLSEWRRIC